MKHGKTNMYIRNISQWVLITNELVLEKTGVRTFHDL